MISCLYFILYTSITSAIAEIIIQIIHHHHFIFIFLKHQGSLLALKGLAMSVTNKGQEMFVFDFFWQ